MNPLIPAADLEPTPEQMTEERAHFASCANFDAARAELSVTTVHIEDLAAALAAGHTLTAALRVQAMLATRRAYVERLAELDAAAADEAGSLPRSRVPGATWAAWRRSTVTPDAAGRDR